MPPVLAQYLDEEITGRVGDPRLLAEPRRTGHEDQHLHDPDPVQISHGLNSDGERVVMPMEPNIIASSCSSAWEFSWISAASFAHSRLTCSFWVRTEVYSPIAMQKAPAISPARPVRTMKCGAAPAAPDCILSV